jgi:ribosomal protein S3AE
MAETVMLGTRIPEELRHRVKKFCVDVRKDMQDFVREALEEKLARESAGHAANVFPIRRGPTSGE